MNRFNEDNMNKELLRIKKERNMVSDQRVKRENEKISNIVENRRQEGFLEGNKNWHEQREELLQRRKEISKMYDDLRIKYGDIYDTKNDETPQEDVINVKNEIPIEEDNDRIPRSEVNDEIEVRKNPDYYDDSDDKRTRKKKKDKKKKREELNENTREENDRVIEDRVEVKETNREEIKDNEIIREDEMNDIDHDNELSEDDFDERVSGIVGNTSDDNLNLTNENTNEVVQSVGENKINDERINEIVNRNETSIINEQNYTEEKIIEEEIIDEDLDEIVNEIETNDINTDNIDNTKNEINNDTSIINEQNYTEEKIIEEEIIDENLDEIVNEIETNDIHTDNIDDINTDNIENTNQEENKVIEEGLGDEKKFDQRNN